MLLVHRPPESHDSEPESKVKFQQRFGGYGEIEHQRLVWKSGENRRDVMINENDRLEDHLMVPGEAREVSYPGRNPYCLQKDSSLAFITLDGVWT